MSISPADAIILLVEDDPDISRLTLHMMSRAGLKAAHVDSGSAAISYLEHTKPDLILLDLNLPEVHGWQVLEFAKDKYGETGFKVVVTTANADAANRVIGKLQLVVGYLIKPFTPDKLVKAINEALNPSKDEN